MQGSGTPVSVSDVLSEWFAGIGRHASVSLLAGGLIAVVGTLMDLSLGDRGGQLVSSIASFFIGYHFVEYVLARDFGTPTGQRHYGSAFGSALLSLLGIGAGLILLIIPGLYVAARWSLANALVIGEGLGSTESLRESWHRTRHHAWAIVVCYALLAVVFLGSAVGIGVLIFANGASPTGTPSFLESITGNVLGGALSVIASLLTCALYGLISRPEGALDDVFS